MNIGKIIPIAFMYVIAFCIFVGELNAQTFKYYPDSHFRLGGGFNPIKPTKAYPRCISFTPDTPSSGVPETTFTARVVRSRRDLYESMGFSTEISGHYGIFSADAGLAIDDSSRFHSDSITWVVVARSDFGTTEATDLSLLPTAQKLMDDDDFKSFAASCGTHFVLLEQRQAMVSAVFTVSNLSREETSTLSASFGGGVDTGVWGADVEASYRSFVSEAAKRSQVSVSVYLIGGDGIKSLAPIITGFEDLDKISKTLRGIVESIDKKNAAPSRHTFSDMSIFGLPVDELSLVSRDRAIGEANLINRNILATIDRLRSVINGQSPFNKFISDEEIDYYKSRLADYRGHARDIPELALKCLDDRNVCSAIWEYETVAINWPALPKQSEINISRVSFDSEKMQITGFVTDEGRFPVSVEISSVYQSIFPGVPGSAILEPWKRTKTASLKSVNVDDLDEVIDGVIGGSILVNEKTRASSFDVTIPMIDAGSTEKIPVGALIEVVANVRDTFDRTRSIKVWSR